MNPIDYLVHELEEGRVLEARVPGWSQERHQVIRLGRRVEVDGPAAYVACRFSFDCPTDVSWSRIEDYERLETDNLDRAAAFAGRHNVAFHRFRSESIHPGYYFYDFPTDWLVEEGLCPESARAMEEGEQLEARAWGPEGYTTVLRFTRTFHFDNNIIDPKDDKPRIRITTLERKLNTYLSYGHDDDLGRRNFQMKEFTDLEAAIAYGRKFVPDLSAWLYFLHWEDWDRQDGLLHPDS